MKTIIVLVVIVVCVGGCEGGGGFMPPGYWSNQIKEQQAEDRMREIEYQLDIVPPIYIGF